MIGLFSEDKFRTTFFKNSGLPSTTFKKSAGFTLLELLVVIVIIGILLSVVLSSVNSSRAKARDSKRLADMQQMALALEFYANVYKHYPPTAGATAAVRWADLADCLEAQPASCPDNSDSYKILAATPNDPLGSSPGFVYDYSSNADQDHFVLAVRLERSSNPVLSGNVEGVLSDFSSINCDNPVYCIQI